MGVKIEVPDIFNHLASAIMQKYFDEYKGVAKWLEDNKRQAHEEELCRSPFGRIEHLPDINCSHGNKVAEAERQANNMPIQSGASDIGQRACIRLDRFMMQNPKFSRETGIKYVATVHDSFLFEVNKEQALETAKTLKGIFEDISELDFMRCPMRADVEIGVSYGELNGVDLETDTDIDEILTRKKK